MKELAIVVDANNCGCNEHQNVASWGTPVSPGKTDGIHHYEGEIQATIDFGFDGIKLDGALSCSPSAFSNDRH